MTPLAVTLLIIAVAVVLPLLLLLLRPALTLKLLVRVLRHTFIRLRVEGAENLPDSGPVLIVSNHVSLIDMART